MGWPGVRTPQGKTIVLRKSPFGTVTKIQRPENLSEKELREIEEICRKHKSIFIKIEPGLEQNLHTLEKEGYIHSYHPLLPPSTVFIDLTETEDMLWKAVSKTGRYSIRRAQREGATVETYKNPTVEQLELLLIFLKQTAAARKILVPSMKDLQKQVELFGNDCHVILVKSKEGEYMAGNYYLGHGESVWFVHGGTSHKSRKGKWGYELTWKSYLYLKVQGYKILDLEGIDDERFPSFTKNWGGFSHFKEKFGGQKVEYPIPRIKLLSPVLLFLQKFYKTLPL